MKHVLAYLFALLLISGSAQDLEQSWQCTVSSLAGIDTDTIDGEAHYVLPFDSTTNYDSWCGSFLPTGNWVGYHDSTHAQLESKFYVVKGAGLHGECLRWYNNGQLRRKAFYDQGTIVQYDSNWYENGNLYFVKVWQPDGVVSSKWWFSNGQLEEQYAWKNGEAYGLWLSYDKNGNIIREEDHGE